MFVLQSMGITYKLKKRVIIDLFEKIQDANKFMVSSKTEVQFLCKTLFVLKCLS